MYKGVVEFDVPYLQGTAHDSSVTIFRAIRQELSNKYGVPSFADSNSQTDLSIDSWLPLAFADWKWPRGTNGYRDSIGLSCSLEYPSLETKKAANVSVIYISGKLLNEFYSKKDSAWKKRPQSKDY
jgi:hypothetical protein